LETARFQQWLNSHGKPSSHDTRRETIRDAGSGKTGGANRERPLACPRPTSL
jgi:hypothetical protein